MLTEKQELRLKHLLQRQGELSISTQMELDKLLELQDSTAGTIKTPPRTNRKNVINEVTSTEITPDLVKREYFVIYKGYYISSKGRVFKKGTDKEIKTYPMKGCTVVRLTIRGSSHTLSLTKLIKELFPTALI